MQITAVDDEQQENEKVGYPVSVQREWQSNCPIGIHRRLLAVVCLHKLSKTPILWDKFAEILEDVGFNARSNPNQGAD